MQKIEELLQQYITAAKEQERYANQGNHKKVNKNYHIEQKACKTILSFGETGTTALLGLLEHDDEAVRLAAATHALQIDELKARAALRRIVDEEGFLAFDAKMVLKEWEAGNLRPLDNL